ncbi:Matrilin-2 [Liparis tanakae]|uniref:Matrilin-2 n=1 Tax=Liparis tanakae TaxID=230148 RepID=A0A4Z2DYI6_9TELE|nr:Matrilin-2 [Liparis tanakae]
MVLRGTTNPFKEPFENHYVPVCARLILTPCSRPSHRCVSVSGSEVCEVVDHRCQHQCVSSPASYRCACRKGFTLNPDGKNCTAEDRCAAADHGCGHICANLPGGYECRCRPGYQLNADLKTCSSNYYFTLRVI